MPTAPATSSPGAARFSLRAAHGGAAKTTLEIPWTSRTACRGFIRVAARNEATSEVYDRSVNDRKNPSLRRAADFLSVFFADRRRELHAAAHRVPRRRGRARRGRGKLPYRIVLRRIVCCRRARALASAPTYVLSLILFSVALLATFLHTGKASKKRAV